MNTAHVVLRTLLVVWGVLFVVMATLLALYLIERRLDRSNDWELWEDDLDEFDELDVDVSYRTAPYDWERERDDAS